MDWRVFLKLWVVILAITMAIATGVGIAIILVKTFGSLSGFILTMALLTGLAALTLAVTEDDDEDD